VTAVILLAAAILAITGLAAYFGVMHVAMSKRYLTAEDERRKLLIASGTLRGEKESLEARVGRLEAALRECDDKRARAEVAAVASADPTGLRDLANGVLADADDHHPDPRAPAPVRDGPTARLRGAAGAMEELP
jgi:hypothetical protein